MDELREAEIRRAFENVRYEVPASKVIAAARRHQHRRRLAFGAVPAVGLLAAAGYALRSEPTSEPFTVGCYSAASQEADTTILRWERGKTPAEVCLSEPEAWGSDIPRHVVTCVTGGGGTGVFPNPNQLDAEEACAAIGAAVPDEGPHYGGLTAGEVREMSHDLGTRTEVLNDPDARAICYPADTLRREVERFFRERDLTQWTVKDLTTQQAATSASGQRCGDIVYDSLDATVVIVDGDRAD